MVISKHQYKRAIGTLAVAASAFAAFAFQARSAGAATTITVNGSCSLSQAVSAVNTQKKVGSCGAGTGGDTIIVPSGTTTNVSSTLTITRSVTIRSPNSTVISNIFTTSGSHLSALFAISPIVGTAASVTFANVQLVDLDGTATGISAVGKNSTDKLTVNASLLSSFGNSGISASAMSVTVHDCSFDNNSGQLGGAISVQGSASNAVLNVSNTTFQDNGADAGGAIYDSAPAHSIISNSTFNRNSATMGGALALFGSGTYDILGSTIAFNSASSQGGGGINTATVNFNLTLIAGNTIGGDPNFASDWDFNSVINSFTDSLVANIFSYDGTGQFSDLIIENLGVNSIINADAASVINGGDAFTLGGDILAPPGALLLPPTSPAIDAIPANTSSLATDERGFARGIDVAGGVGSNKFDIGAIEYDPNLQAENVVARTITNGTLSAVSGITGFQPSSGKGIKFVPGSSGASSVTFHLPMYNGGGAQSLTLHIQSCPTCGRYQISIGDILLPPTDFIPIGTQSFSSSTTKVVTLPAMSLAPFDPNGFGEDDVVDIKFTLVSKPAGSNGQMVLDFIKLQ
jgi:predicted outer membrane repeat protein